MGIMATGILYKFFETKEEALDFQTHLYFSNQSMLNSEELENYAGTDVSPDRPWGILAHLDGRIEEPRGWDWTLPDNGKRIKDLVVEMVKNLPEEWDQFWYIDEATGFHKLEYQRVPMLTEREAQWNGEVPQRDYEEAIDSEWSIVIEENHSTDVWVIFLLEHEARIEGEEPRTRLVGRIKNVNDQYIEKLAKDIVQAIKEEWAEVAEIDGTDIESMNDYLITGRQLDMITDAIEPVILGTKYDVTLMDKEASLFDKEAEIEIKDMRKKADIPTADNMALADVETVYSVGQGDDDGKEGKVGKNGVLIEMKDKGLLICTNAPTPLEPPKLSVMLESHMANHFYKVFKYMPYEKLAKLLVPPTLLERDAMSKQARKTDDYQVYVHKDTDYETAQSLYNELLPRQSTGAVRDLKILDGWGAGYHTVSLWTLTEATNTSDAKEQILQMLGKNWTGIYVRKYGDTVWEKGEVPPPLLLEREAKKSSFSIGETIETSYDGEMVKGVIVKIEKDNIESYNNLYVQLDPSIRGDAVIIPEWDVKRLTLMDREAEVFNIFDMVESARVRGVQDSVTYNFIMKDWGEVAIVILSGDTVAYAGRVVVDSPNAQEFHSHIMEYHIDDINDEIAELDIKNVPLLTDREATADMFFSAWYQENPHAGGMYMDPMNYPDFESVIEEVFNAYAGASDAWSEEDMRNASLPEKLDYIKCHGIYVDEHPGRVTKHSPRWNEGLLLLDREAKSKSKEQYDFDGITFSGTEEEARAMQKPEDWDEEGHIITLTGNDKEVDIDVYESGVVGEGEFIVQIPPEDPDDVNDYLYIGSYKTLDEALVSAKKELGIADNRTLLDREASKTWADHFSRYNRQDDFQVGDRVEFIWNPKSGGTRQTGTVISLEADGIRLRVRADDSSVWHSYWVNPEWAMVIDRPTLLDREASIDKVAKYYDQPRFNYLPKSIKKRLKDISEETLELAMYRMEDKAIGKFKEEEPEWYRDAYQEIKDNLPDDDEDVDKEFRTAFFSADIGISNPEYYLEDSIAHDWLQALAWGSNYDPFEATGFMYNEHSPAENEQYMHKVLDSVQPMLTDREAGMDKKANYLTNNIKNLIKSVTKKEVPSRLGSTEMDTVYLVTTMDGGEMQFLWTSYGEPFARTFVKTKQAEIVFKAIFNTIDESMDGDYMAKEFMESIGSRETLLDRQAMQKEAMNHRIGLMSYFTDKEEAGQIFKGLYHMHGLEKVHMEQIEDGRWSVGLNISIGDEELEIQKDNGFQSFRDKGWDAVVVDGVTYDGRLLLEREASVDPTDFITKIDRSVIIRYGFNDKVVDKEDEASVLFDKDTTSPRRFYELWIDEFYNEEFELPPVEIVKKYTIETEDGGDMVIRHWWGNIDDVEYNNPTDQVHRVHDYIGNSIRRLEELWKRKSAPTLLDREASQKYSVKLIKVFGSRQEANDFEANFRREHSDLVPLSIYHNLEFVRDNPGPTITVHTAVESDTETNLKNVVKQQFGEGWDVVEHYVGKASFEELPEPTLMDKEAGAHRIWVHFAHRHIATREDAEVLVDKYAHLKSDVIQVHNSTLWNPNIWEEDISTREGKWIVQVDATMNHGRDWIEEGDEWDIREKLVEYLPDFETVEIAGDVMSAPVMLSERQATSAYDREEVKLGDLVEFDDFHGNMVKGKAVEIFRNSDPYDSDPKVKIETEGGGGITITIPYYRVHKQETLLDREANVKFKPGDRVVVDSLDGTEPGTFIREVAGDLNGRVLVDLDEYGELAILSQYVHFPPTLLEREASLFEQEAEIVIQDMTKEAINVR